jgi:bifunctional non-homologous end joining protein LigD
MSNTGTLIKARRTRRSASKTAIYRSVRETPADLSEAQLEIDGLPIKVTNLKKLFWPEEGITKRDLLQYYENIAPFVLPHIRNRAMVMKRYPNGATEEYFFQKRAPVPRPEYVPLCHMEHDSSNIIDYPVINNAASLLWLVNLGCIDLNQWYATCDNVNKPDYLHFDLDPVPTAGFECVRDAALLVRDALHSLEIPSYPKTTGSKGIHIYVPIQRGPDQKQVWAFAKKLAREVASQNPNLITSEYRIAKRPKNHVLIDYNQNAWGRTLASVYSARPKPRATVSAPVTWDEVASRISIEDFRIDNMPERIREGGDLFEPLFEQRGRFKLDKFV